METEFILQKLAGIEASQKRILEVVLARAAPVSYSRLDQLIDPVDLAAKLKIADRTLRRYKNAGILIPLNLGARDYYIEEEVIEAMRKSGLSKK